MPEVTLNLPGRDQKIEEYKQYLRNLAKAGIFYTTYAHMGNGIWSSERETTRGGAPARAFHLETAKGYWAGKVSKAPLTHGRKYTKEELWENYTYFIKQVVPVAEEVGIRIGIHPDDPPVPELGGVPRCIFGNFDGYVRALEIANSPNIGVCLCCGTWMEGGKGMGKDVLRSDRALSPRWASCGRSISAMSRAPIPHFVETFVDNGYTDMRKVMRTLVEVDFRGILIADHVPEWWADAGRLGLQHRLHQGDDCSWKRVVWAGTMFPADRSPLVKTLSSDHCRGAKTFRELIMRTLNPPGLRIKDGVISFLGPWVIASLWDDPNEAEVDQNGKMSFLDHLDELRRRLIVSIVAVGIAFFICWAFREKIYDFVTIPITQFTGGAKLKYVTPAEPFSVYMQISLLAGIFLASPIILWQVWLFISPGLYRREKRFALPFLAATTILFLLGGAFAYRSLSH